MNSLLNPLLNPLWNALLNALINHVQSLYTVSDEIHSIVVCSQGQYGFANGVWADMPVRTISPGTYEVVDNYKHDDFAKEAPINTFSVEDMKNIEFFKIDNHDNWKRFIESNDEEYSGGHPTSEHNKILSDKLYEYINA